MLPLSTPTTLRSLRALSQRCHFPTAHSRTLWNGTTQPYINHAIPNGSTIQQHQASQNTPSPLIRSTPASQDAEHIRKIHTKYIEDLLSRAASSHNLETSVENASDGRSSRRTRTRAHSLSEPPLFRTDGPLTPYPIELDTGERLEPKHATLVRIVDKSGAQRSIVVAEVDDESGNQRSILLALDLQDYSDEGTAVGRRITAEEMYATLGMEAQGGKS
jgi:hypothetical protein